MKYYERSELRIVSSVGYSLPAKSLFTFVCFRMLSNKVFSLVVIHGERRRIRLTFFNMLYAGNFSKISAKFIYYTIDILIETSSRPMKANLLELHLWFHFCCQSIWNFLAFPQNSVLIDCKRANFGSIQWYNTLPNTF